MSNILKWILGGILIAMVLVVLLFVWPVPQLIQTVVSKAIPAAPTRDPLVEALATGQAQQAQALTAIQAQLAQTKEPVVIIPPATPTNDLINPVLHHADSQPPENGVGSFDVGVKQGQIGLAFGWHIAWPKGSVDAGGGGCDLVILTPGWYENLQVQDGRYEVYDVPSSDYAGWVKVLGQQRADEQAKDYGCPAKSFQDLPQWESPILSPP